MTPVLLRFADLKARGIVQSWPTLYRWIEFEGFPPGMKLGRKMRVWTDDEVAGWIADQGGIARDQPDKLSALEGWKRKRDARQA
jgi:predicted DNA-binding transcriptional regulator AlpA